MEGIDLALLIQIFKGFKSTLPRPASPRRFCQFLRGGPGQDLVFAGRGGVGAHPWCKCTVFRELQHWHQIYTALTLQMCGIDIT